MRAVFRFLNQPHLVTRRIFLAATAALTLIATALSPSPKAWAQSPPERLIDRAYHGDYGTERQALHRSIVEYSLRGIEQTASSPTFTVLAGPMASGKSTRLRQTKPSKVTSPILPTRCATKLPWLKTRSRTLPRTISTMLLFNTM